mmetsp:Transcript_3962/g.9357  ORF Transcript_3962/g.9357 Transcript_3962/m.9357 type:complete len:226 (+) Transcript_3962:99-776(+)
MPKKQAKACVQPTQMVKTDGKDVVMDENLVLFHKGWPSQWHMSDFEDEEGKRFNCCEQYMMFHKARLMGDMDTAQDVMKTANPAQQKRLGRLVANFDADLWDKACDEVVYRGNLFKFAQNAELRAELLATGHRTLAEASPYDKIWGIGLAAENWSAWNPKLWKGANRLGKALMRVRAELIAQGGREGAREGGEGAREGAKEGAREGAREGAAVVEPARVAAAAAL